MINSRVVRKATELGNSACRPRAPRAVRFGAAAFLPFALLLLSVQPVLSQEELTEVLQIQAEKVTVRHSAEWSVAPAPLKGLQELVYRPVSEMAGTQPASIKIRFEHRADRDEALLRLQQIGDGIGAISSRREALLDGPHVNDLRAT